MFRGSQDSHVLINSGVNDLGTFIIGAGGFVDSGTDLISANYGDWHHLGAVGGAGNTTFYIDGVKAGTAPGKSDDHLTYVGNFTNARFAQFLDDLRVYGVALSSTDMAVLYGAGSGDVNRTPSLPQNLAHTLEKGKLANYQIPAQDAASFSATGLPAGLSIDPASGIISGTPQSTGLATVDVNASNLYGSKVETLALRIVDFDAYSAKMEIRFPGAALSGTPSDLPGLSLWLDAQENMPEVEGSRVTSWQDSSGNGNHLDKVRGSPVLGTSDSLNSNRVVRFDGYSQLHSSTDFGPMLSEYSIISMARYMGGDDENVISSIGASWSFGFRQWQYGSLVGRRRHYGRGSTRCKVAYTYRHYDEWSARHPQARRHCIGHK